MPRGNNGFVSAAAQFNEDDIWGVTPQQSPGARDVMRVTATARNSLTARVMGLIGIGARGAAQEPPQSAQVAARREEEQYLGEIVTLPARFYRR